MDIKERILKGLNFFEVFVCTNNIDAELTLCTYRPKEAITDLFPGAEIWSIKYNVISAKYGDIYFPIYFVELHNSYKSLDTMAEDLMAWRLSGLMDKELVGII